jgi:hypothetical protein
MRFDEQCLTTATAPAQERTCRRSIDRLDEVVSGMVAAGAEGLRAIVCSRRTGGDRRR